MTKPRFIKSKYFFLLLILLLGSLLRFYKLGQIPSGFVSDEASFGYNAYSLIKTGKDEFGQSWPIIFRSFGDGKMPVYFYLTIPSVLILGLTELAVRLPSALLGSITVLLVYLFIRELAPKRKNFALFSALVLATLPWHIHFSRAAFEANLGLFFITLGSWLFLRFVNHRQNKALFFSLFSFTMAIFSYHAPRIFVPLWLVYLIWYFRKKINLKKTIISLAIIVALPWVLLTFSKQSLLRAGGITIFHQQSGVFQRLEQKFTQTRNQPLLLTRALHNRPVEYSLDFLRRYFSHFDSDFLFFTGDPIRPRYRSPDVGQSLWFGLPFFFIGLYFLAKHRLWPILIWLILAPISSAITFETPSSIRALLMITPLALTLALGASETISWLRKQKTFVQPLLLLIVSVFVYSLVHYLDAYFIHLPVHQPYEWQGGYKQLVEKVTELMPNYDKAVITDARGTPYIYFLFYNQYNPARWHAQAEESITIDPKFKYISIGKLDNLYFVSKTCPANPKKWSPDSDIPEANVLYVCTEEHHPINLLNDGTLRVIDTIYFDDGQPAFVLMEKVSG